MTNICRSLLFAPGSRPEIFSKTLVAGADLVAIDLEDAVAPALKADARVAGIRFLGESDGPGPRRALRMNALDTAFGLADLGAIADASLQHGLLFMPKINSPRDLQIADTVLTAAGSGLGLIALIETLDGLEAVHEIAQATPRLELLMFGGVDFSVELGTTLDREPLYYARARIVHAARRAGIPALDVPTIAFRDNEIVRSDAEYARLLGFSGKAVLHPSNVATVNEAFSPSNTEIEEAKAIIAAFEASKTGVAVLDGKLVEAPVVKAMQNILALATAEGRA
jgi:citrate lyase beta subunit